MRNVYDLPLLTFASLLGSLGDRSGAMLCLFVLLLLFTALDLLLTLFRS